MPRPRTAPEALQRQREELAPVFSYLKERRIPLTYPASKLGMSRQRLHAYAVGLYRAPSGMRDHLIAALGYPPELSSLVESEVPHVNARTSLTP